MDEYVPKLTSSQARWARFLGVLAGLVVLGWLLHRLSDVLTPMAAALAIAYILNPLVTRLEKRGVRRLTTIAIIYVVGILLTVTIVVFLSTAAIAQFNELVESVPGYLQGAYDWLVLNHPGLAERLGDQEQITQLLQDHGSKAATSLLEFGSGLASNVSYWLMAAILIPLYAFFFLWKFEPLVCTVRDHLPAAYRPVIVRIVTTIDRATAEFFRGRLIVCLIVAVLTSIGWTIVGVRYGVPLGAAVGALSLVPFVSILALPPALIFAWLEAVESGEGWIWPVVLAMAVYMVVQGLESFVFTPWVESKSSGLHPVTTVVALLIGGQLLGLLGMLLSIPIASTLKSLGGEYIMPEVRRLAGTSDGAPPGPEPPPNDAPPKPAVEKDEPETGTPK